MNQTIEEENEIKILRFVQSKDSVSIYSIISHFNKMDIEQVISLVYYLAGRKLVSLGLEEDEDGAETIVKKTPLTSIHLSRTG